MALLTYDEFKKKLWAKKNDLHLTQEIKDARKSLTKRAYKEYLEDMEKKKK